MNTRVILTVAAGLLGLVVAAALGYAALQLISQPIGVSSVPARAGEQLVGHPRSETPKARPTPTTAPATRPSPTGPPDGAPGADSSGGDDSGHGRDDHGGGDSGGSGHDDNGHDGDDD